MHFLYTSECSLTSSTDFLLKAKLLSCIKGVKQLCRYQHKFGNVYLFGAFSPITGKHLLLELPHCNTDNFQAFLSELSKTDSEEFKIVVLDNGAFHKAKRLLIQSNIALIFLPPYSPKLKPAEKVWWVLKRQLKNKFFKTMEALQADITSAAKDYPTTVSYN